MKFLRIALFASLAGCSVSAAWAQYGLYGSPEMLRLPQQNTDQGYAPSAAYPTTAAAVPQPAPVSTYSAPQPQSRYALQPQYGYPPQPAATAMYQPYQPGAQYRYPGPAVRPPVRTAALEPTPASPPVPAPPAVPAGAPPAMTGPSPSLNEGPVPQSPGLMNQMLSEQDGYGYSQDGCGACGPYRGALNRFDQAACGSNGGGCGCDGPCDPCCGRSWYASVSALVMGRSDSGTLWTSYKQSDQTVQAGNTNFGLHWQWGGEVRFGHCFCCGCTPYALEATYWTTEAFTGCRTTSFPGDTVNTVLSVDNITFHVPGSGVDTPANTWFMGAGEQTLYRRDEFHNIEVNLIRQPLAWGCDSPWDVGWSVGVRYFRFQEALTFDSVMPGHAPGDVYDAYLSDNVTNNLVGAQVGFDVAYNLCSGLWVFITPKVGIYNNFIDSTFQAQLGNHVTNGFSSPYGTYYPIHGTTNALSFLTQIDVGAEWQFTRNWSARAGYRVVAVTGVGLAEEQFPQYICDVPGLETAAHTSSLVLHGAFLGLTYCF